MSYEGRLFFIALLATIVDKSVTGFSGLDDIDSGKQFWLKGKIPLENNIFTAISILVIFRFLYFAF
jgi:hypothetical protein